jgi:hypothetical protein
MKKLFFLIAFFLLAGANSAIISFAADRTDDDIEMPIGEDRDVSEEDDDEVTLDHLWISRDKSSDSGLHIVYQEILFKNLDIEIVIPPPKA